MSRIIGTACNLAFLVLALTGQPAHAGWGNSRSSNGLELNGGGSNGIIRNGGGVNGGGTNGMASGLSTFTIDGIELTPSTR